MLPGYEGLTESLKKSLGDEVVGGVVFRMPLDGQGKSGGVFFPILIRTNIIN